MINYILNLQNNDSKNNQFGDRFGEVTLHLLPEFSWLTREIEIATLEYLRHHNISKKYISLFHQKSWPVITRTGGMVASHNHPNASISVVFYLQTPVGSGGELLLENVSDFVSGDFRVQKRESNDFIKIAIKPLEGLLVLFPSSVKHKVAKYFGNKLRLSIAYDISITSSRDLLSEFTENSILHPSYWREFQD